MAKEFTFIFDRIDPEQGLIPNIIFEPLPSVGNHTYERFIRKTFSDYELKFRPTYLVDDEFGWLYPIFLNNLILLNSIRHILSALPSKIKKGIKRKKGKIIIFILEPFSGHEAFSLFESLATQDTPDFIYMTLHTSSIKNVINYDSTILEREQGLIHEFKTSKTCLSHFDNRRFSCFLYYYMDCPSRLMFLSFLEKTNIIDDIFISAKERARDFGVHLKNMGPTDLGRFHASFSSFYKVFDYLSIYETLEKSLINIIFEAEILFDSPNKVITEKVFRCIESEKPFILLSHPEALKYFKNLGYMSFSPLINESYDNINDPKSRVDTVFNEITRLSKIPLEELKVEIDKLKPVFQHNKKILASNHSKTQRKVYKELHNDLLQ